MYYNKVEICGVNTSKLKTLTAEEKHDLLIKAHNGDADARQQLIDGNLRLVLSIIQRFTNRGENMDDLFQVGCIGLIKAVDNFNIELDVKFSTYAVPMNIPCGNVILPLLQIQRQDHNRSGRYPSYTVTPCHIRRTVHKICNIRRCNPTLYSTPFPDYRV